MKMVDVRYFKHPQANNQAIRQLSPEPHAPWGQEQFLELEAPNLGPVPTTMAEAADMST